MWCAWKTFKFKLYWLAASSFYEGMERLRLGDRNQMISRIHHDFIIILFQYNAPSNNANGFNAALSKTVSEINGSTVNHKFWCSTQSTVCVHTPECYTACPRQIIHLILSFSLKKIYIYNSMRIAQCLGMNTLGFVIRWPRSGTVVCTGTIGSFVVGDGGSLVSQLLLPSHVELSGHIGCLFSLGYSSVLTWCDLYVICRVHKDTSHTESLDVSYTEYIGITMYCLMRTFTGVNLEQNPR